jgi:hypothetical protein
MIKINEQERLTKLLREAERIQKERNDINDPVSEFANEVECLIYRLRNWLFRVGDVYEAGMREFQNRNDI